HLLEEGSARAQLFAEPVLNETGERVVKTVGKGEGSATLAARAATSVTHVFEKFFRRFSGRRFSVSRSDELAAVIVGAGDEDFFPRFGVSRREIVAIGQR